MGKAADAVRKWASGIVKSAHGVVVDSFNDLSTGIINDTPVLQVDAATVSSFRKKGGLPLTTGSVESIREQDGYPGGLARGNWQASIGSPIREKIRRVDPESDETSRAAVAVSEQSKPGDSLLLCNSISYIGDLEDGTSGQAPAGMVRVNLHRVAREISK